VRLSSVGNTGLISTFLVSVCSGARTYRISQIKAQSDEDIFIVPLYRDYLSNSVCHINVLIRNHNQNWLIIQEHTF